MNDDENPENIKKLEDIDHELAERCGNQIYEGIQKEFSSTDNDGGYNPRHLWKLRKKATTKDS